MTQGRLDLPVLGLLGWGLLIVLASLPVSAHADTTETTTYTYNADGALTSVKTVTRQGHGEVSEDTQYLTWDNFEAHVANAATGTLTAANGNLIGIGSLPGDESAWSAHYDLLDRPVQVTNQEQQTAVYRYHPDELLAASLNAEAPSSDGLQHYYDESRYPQVTNLYDRHTRTLSSRHQRIRYLPDGTEQMLVRHRKDVDGVYELKGQTMSGYQYDPYGATAGQTLTSGMSAGPLYSLRKNPYQYSHELRDPVSGADYLRARWYLPGHQTFLQRDPVPNLNRYGYAHGNPIMYHDPGGTTALFFSSLEKSFARTFTSGLGIVPLVRGRAFSSKASLVYQSLQVGGMVLGAAASFAAGAQPYFLLMAIATGSSVIGVTGQAAKSAFDEKRQGLSTKDIIESQFGGAIGGALGMAAVDLGAATPLTLVRLARIEIAASDAPEFARQRQIDYALSSARKRLKALDLENDAEKIIDDAREKVSKLEKKQRVYQKAKAERTEAFVKAHPEKKLSKVRVFGKALISKNLNELVGRLGFGKRAEVPEARLDVGGRNISSLEDTQSTVESRSPRPARGRPERTSITGFEE